MTDPIIVTVYDFPKELVVEGPQYPLGFRSNSEINTLIIEARKNTRPLSTNIGVSGPVYGALNQELAQVPSPGVNSQVRDFIESLTKYIKDSIGHSEKPTIHT